MLDPSQGDTIADGANDTSPTESAIPQSIAVSTFSGEMLRFRAYTLFPASRTLLRDGDPVCIGGRAFDLLVILLRNRGRVTPKTTITDYVWPSTYLEESNLRFQVAALRRALGPDADLIKTVPGRGYLLAAEAIQADAYDRLSPALGVENSLTLARPTATGRTPTELLEELLHSVGLLVASYGSLEGFLGALASHHLPVADSFLPPPERRTAA